jgi:hypothetical protein
MAPSWTGVFCPEKRKGRSFNMRRCLVSFIFGLFCATATGLCAATEGAAVDLRVQYESLRPALERSPFDRPLHLESREAADRLDGDVHAVLDYPFGGVRSALDGGQRWCDILLLHLNVKACRPASQGSMLGVYIGKKFDEPASQAHKIDFAYRTESEAPDYFRRSLTAANGPFGTRDYRIVVEAVPLNSGRTFVHLSYGYAYGPSAKMAMEAYLRTVAGEKVGFTVQGRRPDGRPALVGGLRGALERNVMRYYLAIDAYLAALAAPPDERLEERLRDWFESTERYALQLHELDQGQYLDMKRKECAEQASQP